MSQFCSYLHNLQSQIFNWCQSNCQLPMKITPEQVKAHKNACLCECCGISFFYVDKIMHHSHLSGKFIASVCSPCNLKMKQQINQLPIVFHNLIGYNGHFIINASAESPYE